MVGCGSGIGLNHWVFFPSTLGSWPISYRCSRLTSVSVVGTDIFVWAADGPDKFCAIWISIITPRTPFQTYWLCVGRDDIFTTHRAPRTSAAGLNTGNISVSTWPAFLELKYTSALVRQHWFYNFY